MSSPLESKANPTDDNIHPGNDGVFLTWEGVWVTVSGNHGSRPILQGLTGYAQPGQITAIMGPSGCGKSTLLDTLAGRLSSNTRQSGQILINGQKQTLTFGASAYVTQEDTLMTTLTVREAVYYSALLQLPDSMSTSEKKERVDTTIKEMGLQDAINTRIGGWDSKGLSGGQKRRVSICIEVLTRPKLLFLDEPTSGLDSAASYLVMKRIAALARQEGVTVVTSIHQPSSEVFELFHNLYLLSSGRTVFFGAASSANEARGSMLQFVVCFLTFMAIGGFPSFVEDMKIFRSERLNGHYGVAAFVFSNTFSSVPYLFLISLVPGIIANFLVDHQRSFEHFAYFALVLFSCMMLVEGLMMIVASIVPSFLMGIITGSGIQGVMMLTGGFFRLPDDLPKPVWKYPMHYISFQTYANQGLYKNEFEGLIFSNIPGVKPSTINGKDILTNIWQMGTYSKWVDLCVLLGMAILYRLIFFCIIKMTEKMKAIIANLPKNSTRQTQIVVNPSTTPMHEMQTV